MSGVIDDPHARPCVLTAEQAISALQQLLDFYAGKEAEYYARLWGPEPDERWDQTIESEWNRYRIEAGALRSGIAAIESRAALLAAMEECEDYFDNRADVRDGSYGEPEANNEMRMLQMVRAALNSTKDPV